MVEFFEIPESKKPNGFVYDDYKLLTELINKKANDYKMDVESINFCGNGCIVIFKDRVFNMNCHGMTNILNEKSINKC